MRRLGSVEPRLSASNRVVYRRAGLTEWYANSPLGVEQGFALPTRPVGHGSLSLSVALAGSLAAAAKRNGRAILFGPLVYRGLVVTDARGRKLPARLQLAGKNLLIEIDDRAARYPVKVDPLIQSGELTASDGAANDNLGTSVAISGDTIVAGAPNRNSNQGAVYVFTEPGSGWADAVQTAELTASDGAANDNLGFSVAISGDNIVAGAPCHNSCQGAVYVFRKPGGGWTDATETEELTAADGAPNDYLGNGVAISGQTIAAGAPGRNSLQGAVYVFANPGGVGFPIYPTAELMASDGAPNDWLGFNVAISGDTIASGAIYHSGPGAVYVFTQPDGGWTDATQTAELTASDGAANNWLGYGIAIDGDTIVAGAPRHNSVQGAAYEFTRPAGGWADATQTAELTASDGAAGDRLGWSVAVSGDTIAAGARGHNSFQGAVYVFTKPGADWVDGTETAELTAADGAANDSFGFGVGISGVSNSIAVGAAFRNSGQGAAYVFQPDIASPSISTVQQPAHALVGSPIADQATVLGGSAPTGTVAFNLYDNPNGTGSPLFTDTEPLANGSATSASYTPSGAGTYYWVATYSGDAQNDGVTSGTADEPVVVVTGARVAFPLYEALDPAFASSTYTWQVEYATCLELYSYADDPAPSGYQLVPDAATGMPTVSSDGLVWTFTVKSGLKFSDGTDVTADSFRRAIERAAGTTDFPGYGSYDIPDIAGIGAFQDGSASSISGVQVLGNQLKITLTQPDGALASKLADPYFCAVPANTPLEVSDVPLPSAGPYYIDPASVNASGIGFSLRVHSFTLLKNPYYTGSRPAALDEIDVVVESTSASYQAAQSGVVDYTKVGLPDQAGANASYGPGSPAAAAGHQQYFTPIIGAVRYLIVNTSRSLLMDTRVRQAIATAIDRTQLASDLGETPTDDLVSPITPGYVDEHNFDLSPGPSDIAAAQSLMQQAGYGPGNHLTLKLVVPSSRLALATDIQSELANIYIDVAIDGSRNGGAYFAFLTNPASDWDLSFVGFLPDYTDWSGVITAQLDGRQMSANSVGTDFAHWNDPQTNASMDYADALPPGLDRNTAYEHLATSLARDSVPMAGISQVADHDFVSSRVGCVVHQPVYGLDLTRLCLATPVSAGDTYVEPGTISSSTPVLAAVTAAADGSVSVVNASVASELSGYNVVGQQLIINAPDAPDTDHPLTIALTVDAATLAASGLDADTVTVLRNGVAVPDCSPNDGTVSHGDDPCVTSRTTDGSGNAVVTILSMHASQWSSGLPDSTPPTLNSISLGSSTIVAGHSTTISASAGSDAVFAEFYVDTDAGAGENIPLGGDAGSLKSPPYGRLLRPGSHTIGVRVRDSAGNWSPVHVVHLQVVWKPVVISKPIVSGIAAVGKQLSTTKGTWTQSPTGYAYKWQRCSSTGSNCVDISLATHATYTLVAADAGHKIRSEVLASNAQGSAAAGYAPSLVTALVVAKPTVISLPVLKGTAKVGHALTVGKGTWTYSPTMFAYHWLRCSSTGTSCVVITGATRSSYALTSADVGHRLEAKVTATNAAGSTGAFSGKSVVVTS